MLRMNCLTLLYLAADKTQMIPLATQGYEATKIEGPGICNARSTSGKPWGRALEATNWVQVLDLVRAGQRGVYKIWIVQASVCNLQQRARRLSTLSHELGYEAKKGAGY